MRKQSSVKPSSEFETFSETFQNRSEEIAGVEDGESDQHQVERVPHLLRGQNQASERVALVINIKLVKFNSCPSNTSSRNKCLSY